ncbi:AMP-binding protein [Streptomycetaceae bacterium NBC_01309]
MESRACLSPARQISELAVRRGDIAATVYESQQIAYSDLDQRVRRLCGLLRRRGVCRGARVAYIGMNSPLLLITLLAAARLAAVFVPLNYRLAPNEMADVVADCRPFVLVVEAEWVMSAELPRVGNVLTLPSDGHVSEPIDAEFEVPAERCHDSDLAALIYTSGSSGRPKGVMLTYGNLWWSSVNAQAMLDVRFDGVTLAAAPLFHIGGLNTFALPTLARGGTVLIHRSFDAERALADLQKYRVESLVAVPTMYEKLSSHPDFRAADLTGLRAPVVAGAPVPIGLIKRFLAKGVALQQAWGLTETSPFATYLPPRDTVRKMGSVGAAMPYVEVQVRDKTGTPAVAPGQPGELWVKGPNVTAGYWGNPEATDRAITHDGWLRTGDIGHQDSDGYFYIVGRSSEIVISGGENVYPGEVERVLRDIPEVAEVAVLGIPDGLWGETLVAVASLSPGAHLTLAEVRNFASRRLARYKVPRMLKLVAEMPLNSVGKVDKESLRRLFPQTSDAVKLER